MTQVTELMTRNVRAISPQDTLLFAAKAMESLGIGAMPVCEDQRLVGMVTDRDITVRGVAHDRPVQSTPVSDVMSGAPQCCFEDESIEEAAEKMQAAQVRRLPVVDRADRHLVGMLSLGDIAAKSGDRQQTAETLSEISEPASPAWSAS